MRRLGSMIALALLAGALPSCGGGAGGITPRMRAAPGASIRYATVLRTSPAGRPGRTISAISAMEVRGGADDGYDVSITWSPVHVSGEGGYVVPVNGSATARFTRDERRAIAGEPSVEGDVEAAADLMRVVAEEIVLPEAGLSVGQSWPLPPVTRAFADGSRVSIPRTAHLAQVADGLAYVEVTGRAERAPLTVHGVEVSVEATLEQSFRLRVADAVLVEMRSDSEVVTSSPTGRASHRESAHVERVFGAPPAPEAHRYEPGGRASTCAQRLRGMRTRSERAPRAVDLDPLALVEVSVPVRPTGSPIDEVGPVLVGTDRESLIASAGETDVQHTVTVYVAAPETVSDEDLRQWLEGDVIGYGIEIRRIVQGSVSPPSPERAPEVVALARRMREARSVEPWRAEVRALTALCDVAVEAFEAAESAEPSARAATLRQGLLEAYERCGCETTDLARLERTIDLRVGGPELAWEPVR